MQFHRFGATRELIYEGFEQRRGEASGVARDEFLNLVLVEQTTVDVEQRRVGRRLRMLGDALFDQGAHFAHRLFVLRFKGVELGRAGFAFGAQILELTHERHHTGNLLGQHRLPSSTATIDSLK